MKTVPFPNLKASHLPTRKLIQDSREREATFKMKTWRGFSAVLAESFCGEGRQQRTHQPRRSRSVARICEKARRAAVREKTKPFVPGARVQGVVDALSAEEAQTILSCGLAAAGPCEMTGRGAGLWPFVSVSSKQ